MSDDPLPIYPAITTTFASGDTVAPSNPDIVQSTQSASPDRKSHDPNIPCVDFMPVLANRWLFSREDLDHTPSCEDGMDFAEEMKQRSKGCGVILAIGALMNLSQVVIATACTYLHRFYMTQSLNEFNYQEIAATALWVATKAEEKTQRLESFATCCARKALKANKVPDKERDKWCNVVVYGEAALLEGICFDLVVEHPHIHLLLFTQEYNVPDQISHAAWAFLNDSLRTPLCVLYPPNTIAAAALHAASLRVGVIGLSNVENREWYELMGVELAEVEEAVIMMVEEYTARPEMADFNARHR